MTQAITQAATEATRAAEQAIAMNRTEAGIELRSELISTGSKLGRPPTQNMDVSRYVFNSVHYTGQDSQ